MTEDSPSAEITANIDLEPNDHKRLAILCGPFDQNLRQLEQRLEVYISSRGNAFKLVGQQENVQAGIALLTHLYEETKDLETLDSNAVHLSLQESGVNELIHGSRSDTNSN